MQGEKLFLSVESQHLNVERIMELENCHLIAILVIVDLGKNHQRMLKWKFAEEQDIYMVSKCLSARCFLQSEKQ